MAPPPTIAFALVAAVMLVLIVVSLLIMEFEWWNGFPYMPRREHKRNYENIVRHYNKQMWDLHKLRQNQVSSVLNMCGCNADAVSHLKDTNDLCEGKTRLTYDLRKNGGPTHVDAAPCENDINVFVDDKGRGVPQVFSMK